MSTHSPKPAPRKAHITKRAVDALKPEARPFIAWDDRLTGFGVKKLSGAKTY